MASTRFQHTDDSLFTPAHASPSPAVVDQIASQASMQNWRYYNVSEMHNRSFRFTEVNQMKQVRKETYSHWPYQTSPSKGEMINAGFFNCNVGDRVICLYCDLICQQWTPGTTRPMKVHQKFSPRCPYVIAMLEQQRIAGAFSTNEGIGIVTDDEYEPEVPEGTILASMRWIPHARYAHELCTNELYRRVRQPRLIPRESNTFSDAKLLSQSVKDRLDLPIARTLMKKGFHAFIIASCYENQLRQNGDDFASDCDLQTACTLLQKQINCINGNENNIIIVNDILL